MPGVQSRLHRGGSPRAGTPGMCLAVAAVAALTGCASKEDGLSGDRSGGLRLRGVSAVTEVAQLTGPDSMNRTDRFEVAGQDLGSMFDADGKTWFVFGDTFGRREAGLTGGGGTEWRSNTLAWTTDTDPRHGIAFDGYVVDNTNWATELISSKKLDGVEMTTIPTHGFAANNALYLAYMSVRRWGDPGRWDANYAGFAKSTDDGQTWTKLQAPRWQGDGNFVQVSVAEVEGDLYFWGVPAGRFGGVQLMRVPVADVEQQGAYRYFTGIGGDGQPRWSRDMDAAVDVVNGTVGELSVVWNDYLDSWLMSYTDGTAESAELRQGTTPWGPWQHPVTLVSQRDAPGLYAPYMHRRYTTNGGRTIFFTLSRWGPYNVFWYRADLSTAE